MLGLTSTESQQAPTMSKTKSLGWIKKLCYSNSVSNRRDVFNISLSPFMYLDLEDPWRVLYPFGYWYICQIWIFQEKWRVRATSRSYSLGLYASVAYGYAPKTSMFNCLDASFFMYLESLKVYNLIRIFKTMLYTETR